jgi:hypothetical protein
MEWPGLMVRPAIESINSPLGPTVSKIALNSGCMKSRRSSAMESSICCVSMGSFIATDACRRIDQYHAERMAFRYETFTKFRLQ